MSQESELDSLKSVWAKQSAPLPDMHQKVLRQSRRMLIGAAVAALPTLAAFILFGYLIAVDFDIWRTVFVGIMAMWGLVLWFLSIRHYRGTWKYNSESTHALLDIQVRRCHAEIRVFKITVVFCYLAIGLFALWFFAKAFSDWEIIVSRPSRYVFSWIFVIVYVGAFILWCTFMKKRKIKELEKLKAIAADYKDQLK